MTHLKMIIIGLFLFLNFSCNKKTKTIISDRQEVNFKFNNHDEINKLKENYFICSKDTFFVNEKTISITTLGECCILDSIFAGNLQSSKAFITWLHTIEFSQSEYGRISTKCQGKKIRGKYAFESILEKLITDEFALNCKSDGFSLYGNNFFELMIESIKVFKNNLTIQELAQKTRNSLSKTHFNELYNCEGLLNKEICKIIYQDYKEGKIILKAFNEN